jgi:hypothetical protein
VPGHAEELREPIVIEIEDDFSRLPEPERIRLTVEWLTSLRSETPLDLPVSGAEMVAEARDEDRW